MLFRRQVLGILAGGLLSRLLADSPLRAAACSGAAPSDVDRLLDENPSLSPVSARYTTYSASAVVSLLSIPLLARNAVGSGYALVEEGGYAEGGGVSIQFGAGSWPEAARGLNRFGLIHELTLEGPNGEARECAYFAFMTASPEKDMAQARQALVRSGAAIPRIAAQGRADRSGFASRVDNLALPSRLTWRDADQLTAHVHEATANSTCLRDTGRGAASTFLYSVRRAMLDLATETQTVLFFNCNQYGLTTRKEKDPAVAAGLAERGLTSTPDSVRRLSSVLTNLATGRQTPFSVWYETGSAGAPPLRFEYQVRSFLRLAFEADPVALRLPVSF